LATGWTSGPKITKAYELDLNKIWTKFLPNIYLDNILKEKHMDRPYILIRVGGLFRERYIEKEIYAVFFFAILRKTFKI